MLYWHTQKKRLTSGKMNKNSYEGFCDHFPHHPAKIVTAISSGI